MTFAAGRSGKNRYHALECRTSPLQGNYIVETERLTAVRENWKRSHRLVGGPWLASFEYTGEKDGRFDLDYAEQWFYERLGYEIRETLGSDLLWEGQIYEVDLTYQGYHERRSLRKVRNAIQTLYIDGNNETQETAYATNAVSMAQYGRIEERHTMDEDEVTTAEAEDERDNMLAEVAEAHPEPVRIHENNQDRLRVSVQGYVFTANNKYVTAGDGTNDDVATYATEIINTDCQFLNVGKIETNNATVKKASDIKPRAWERLTSLLGRRSDPETPPYVFQVQSGRTIDYFQLDAEPDYLWQNKQITLPDGSTYESLPWLVRPGIIRNPRNSHLTPLPGTFFQTGGDAVIYEVWYGDDFAMPTISTTRFSDAALLKHIGIRMGALEAER